jgi:hypothetical protein
MCKKIIILEVRTHTRTRIQIVICHSRFPSRCGVELNINLCYNDENLNFNNNNNNNNTLLVEPRYRTAAMCLLTRRAHPSH